MTIKEVYDYEKQLGQVFFDKLKNKLGDRLTIETDNRQLTPEMDALIKQQTMTQNWDYELNKVPTREDVLDLYQSGKASRVQIPLKPLVMPQIGKAPSAIPYLLVSITTCLAENEQLPHMLASQAIEQK